MQTDLGSHTGLPIQTIRRENQPPKPEASTCSQSNKISHVPAALQAEEGAERRHFAERAQESHLFWADSGRRDGANHLDEEGAKHLQEHRVPSARRVGPLGDEQRGPDRLHGESVHVSVQEERHEQPVERRVHGRETGHFQDRLAASQCSSSSGRRNVTELK